MEQGMTCIVGYSLKGKVYIGGDSASVNVNTYGLTVRRDPKVFQNGVCIMGFTTSWRMGDLLRHALVVPERHPDEDIDKWMRTTFINAVRDCLKSGGYAEKEKEKEAGGSFLVGYAGRLFAVYDDYQVEESVDPYNAVGCGSDYAKGAMAAMIQLESVGDPEQMIRVALGIVERNCAGVRAPFTVVTL